MLARDMLCFKGKKLSLNAWARELGLSIQVLRYRLKRGWPLAEVLSPKLRQPGAGGYGLAISSVFRDALTALSDGDWLPPEHFLPAKATPGSSLRGNLIHRLAWRDFIERHPDPPIRYRITAVGKKALSRALGPKLFIGHNRSRKSDRTA